MVLALVSGMIWADGTLAPVLPATAEPGIFAKFGLMLWPLLVMSATGIGVLIERSFHLHRSQINASQFLAGVRNVLKSNNAVEALAICDATPGPVAQIAKAAILNRSMGRERLQESLDEVVRMETPRLERNLPVLATLAQIAPMVGFLGTILSLMSVVRVLQGTRGAVVPADLLGGVWNALYAGAGGIAVGIFCYAAFNYLVSRIDSIELDMEKTSAEVIRMVMNEGLPAGGGVGK